MPVKFAKKALRSGKRFVKKRYGIGKKRTLNASALARDVAKMAMMINAEKKIYSAVITTGPVGQVNGNSTGAIIYDITPYIAKGSAVNQITGNGYKMHSALYSFQFNQQANLSIKQKVIIDFFINTGQPLDPAGALSSIFASSTFSGVVDANSSRTSERYPDYRLIRSVKRTLAPDPLSGDSTTATFTVPMKFNRGKGHHVKLTSNATPTDWTSCNNGQLLMVIRADVGNASIVASTLSVPLQTAQTGSFTRFAYKVWYYDN